MARLTGRLVFDRNRTAAYSASMSGISNVPIVLQNLSSKLTLAVFTDDNGNYEFNNVPNGNYQIVEYYGFSDTVASPGNFNDAFVNEILNTSVTPPISYITNPPQSSTNLDCTTRNTFLITVNTINLTNNFLNGPVRYTPIETILDDNVIILPDNLINLADGGTFGKFPAGTTANTGANPNPYPEIVTSFEFVQPNSAVVTPADGQYTIQNIMNNSHSNQVGTWWRIADHTLGNESGRMMVINGYNPGSIIYGETITVLPNTYYLFSAWILNLCFKSGYVDPAFGVKIYDENGEVLYSASLGELITKNTYCPEWRQIGTALYSGNNTIITVQFISEGHAATGNDYVLDDIRVNPLIITPYSPVKSADVDTLNVGDTVKYTVTLENSGEFPLTNVSFIDQIPDGLMFVSGSVTINDIVNPDVDPNIGFSVSDIEGKSTLNISFSAIAISIPDINPTINNANITYSYSPVKGGIPLSYNEISNDVLVHILSADLAITKRANAQSVSPGEILTYTLQIENKGPDTAENVYITDEYIIGLSNIEYSIDDGDTWQLWTGNHLVHELIYGSKISILIRGNVSDDAPNIITNTATVNSDTLDPDLDNNTATVNTNVNFSADISVLKIANTDHVMYGDTLTYTIVVSNNGPDAAKNVDISDITPTCFSNSEFSVGDGSVWNPWVTPYSIGDLANGESKTFYIKGIIDNPVAENIVNTVVVASDTPDPNLDNNTSTVTVTFETNADISVTKEGKPNPVVVGEMLTYTITVSNNGPDIAENIVVTDDIPESLTNLEYSIDDGNSWNPWLNPYLVGNLNPNNTLTILIRGIVSNNASRTITNCVKVNSDTPDTNLDNNTDTDITNIIPSDEYADLSIIKTSNTLIAQPCNTIIYTIKVSNAGPNTAINAIIEDIVPSNLYHVRYSLNNGKTWQKWNNSLNLGDLNANEELTLLIKGVVKKCIVPKIINTATVGSDTPDPDITNNTSTNIIDFQLRRSKN